MKTHETTVRGGGWTLAETATALDWSWSPPCLDDVLVVDVETSGLDPRRHGVLEIGAVAPDGAEFQDKCWLDADRQWEQGALDVNGYSSQELYKATSRDFEADKAGLLELRAGFLKWLAWKKGEGRRWTLAGCNVGAFDLQFLRHMSADAVQPDFDAVVAHRTRDLGTLAMACELVGIFRPPQWGWNADAIFEACGLGREPKPHSAITGARMSNRALWFMAKALHRANP